MYSRYMILIPNYINYMANESNYYSNVNMKLTPLNLTHFSCFVAMSKQDEVNRYNYPVMLTQSTRCQVCDWCHQTGL